MAAEHPQTTTIPLKSDSILSINMNHVTKLNNTNDLMWSIQVRAFLDGYGLAQHIDGTSVPAATITTAEVTSENPAFVKYNRQDRLIFSALLGAISPTLQPVVSITKSASEIWSKLASIYAKPSWGHVKQLKAQLIQPSKGTKSIDDYLQGITMKLALLENAMTNEDAIDIILDDLPDEYKNAKDQIKAKDTTPLITEVHERLLNHEAKILVKGMS